MRNLVIIAAIVIAGGCAKKITSPATANTPVSTPATVPAPVKSDTVVVVSPVAPVVTAPNPGMVSPLFESKSSMAGRAIYDAKCGRCHPLFKTDEYTVKEWQPIIARMAPKARLDSTEKANVMAYVNFHAKAG